MRPKGTKNPYICPTCGKTFWLYPSTAKRSATPSCSPACYHARKRATPVVCSCSTCGKQFFRKPSKAQAARKFCSPECSKAPKLLWAYTIKTADCWICTATPDEHGYPVLSHWRGHRLALAQAIGRDLKPGEAACHTCDVRNCVRNDGPEGVYVVDGVPYRRFGHLWLGTPVANTKDMIEKGRRHSPSRSTTWAHVT